MKSPGAQPSGSNAHHAATGTQARSASPPPLPGSGFNRLSLPEILDDLASRFILNVPLNEISRIERVCYQVEQAHWFYEDFVRPKSLMNLPSFNLKSFTAAVFQRCAFLRAPGGPLEGLTPEQAYDRFRRYKERVPVCGAIILNSAATKCVLVKGYKSNAAWSFPRGKINQSESEWACAVREVREEIGFDISPHLPPEGVAQEGQDYFEVNLRSQRLRLYIVHGVDENERFETQTRQEISKIAWFPLSELAPHPPKKVQILAEQQGRGNARFFSVASFLPLLHTWINARFSRKRNDSGRPPRPDPYALPERTAQMQPFQFDVPAPEQNEARLDRHWAELDAGTRALQGLFFGGGEPQVDLTQSYDEATESGSDFGSDRERGVDLATSYASSISVGSHRPSSAERYSVIAEDVYDVALRNSAYEDHYKHLAAPKPHPPNTVGALLALLQSSTPAPTIPVLEERTPRNDPGALGSPGHYPDRYHSSAEATPNAARSPGCRSPLGADERQHRHQILLNQLEALALGKSSSSMFPPPPGPSSPGLVNPLLSALQSPSMSRAKPVEQPQIVHTQLDMLSKLRGQAK